MFIIMCLYNTFSAIIISIPPNTNTDSNTYTNTNTHTNMYLCTYIHMHTSKLRTHMDTRGLGYIKATVVEDDTIVDNVLPVEQFWIKPMQQALYKEVT